MLIETLLRTFRKLLFSWKILKLVNPPLMPYLFENCCQTHFCSALNSCDLNSHTKRRYSLSFSFVHLRHKWNSFNLFSYSVGCPSLQIAIKIYSEWKKVLPFQIRWSEDENRSTVCLKENHTFFNFVKKTNFKI